MNFDGSAIIERVEFVLCGFELPTPIPLSCGKLTHRNFGLVKIYTKDGTVGIGETSVNFPPWLVHERRATIEDGLSDLIVGENALEIDRLWNKMVDGTRAFTRMWAEGALLQAISGVDMALWDIAGKIQGKPIYELIGGAVRNQIECYAVGFSAIEPGKGALEMIDKGYRHAKMRIGFDDEADLKKAREMRDAVGPDFAMLIDANQAFDVDRARKMMKALEPLNLFWLEEPILTDDTSGYQTLRKEFPNTPLAWGENAFTLADTVKQLEKGLVDYVMPDPCRTGGITECIRICKAAAAKNVPFSPHHYGSDVGFVAALHLSAAMENFSIMLRDEAPVALRGDVIGGAIPVENGMARVPTGPGLGIELDEAIISKNTIKL